MTTTQLTKGVDHFRLGLLFAVGSAFTFGMSGPLAKSLMDAGWTPTAAVTARMALGAVVMAIFATIVKPDWFREALQHRKTVIAYGLVPIAGAQLCYYNAVAHLSVGVALLLEYTAPDPGGGLAVGHDATQAHLHDARGCRSRDRRNRLGAGRRVRCSHQHDRRGVGTGRRHLRGVLLHDVRRSRRRRQRAELDHPCRGWTDRRRGRRRHAGHVRRDAA